MPKTMINLGKDEMSHQLQEARAYIASAASFLALLMTGAVPSESPMYHIERLERARKMLHILENNIEQS